MNANEKIWSALKRKMKKSYMAKAVIETDVYI